MPVSFADLELAFDFVSAGHEGENQAYIDRQSGKIYSASDVTDAEEELPPDIEDEKYVEIPHRNELDLGKPLVLDFVGQFLPDDYDECGKSSAEKAPMPGSKPCWRGATPSIAGTISRPRRKKLRCGSGARRAG